MTKVQALESIILTHACNFGIIYWSLKKLKFKNSAETDVAKIADLKIFYRKSGRYKSSKVDQWEDGSCHKWISNDEQTGIQHRDGSGYYIEKGIKYCSKQGFPYAALKEDPYEAGKTILFCENKRLGLSSLSSSMRVWSYCQWVSCEEISKGNPMYETIRTSKLAVKHPARDTLRKCVEVNTASMFTQQQVCFYLVQFWRKNRSVLLFLMIVASFLIIKKTKSRSRVINE